MTPSRTDHELDLIALAQEVWRYRYLIALLAILGGVIGYGATFFTTPLFRAESKLLIERGEPALTQELQPNGEGNELLLDREAVGSQVELLTSTDLLRRVVQNQDLIKHPQFNGASSPGWGDWVRGLIGLETTDRKELGTQTVVRRLRGDLSVFPVDDSRVIAVRYESEDAALTELVVSGVLQEYLALQQEAKSNATRGAAQLLSKEIDVLRAKVQQSEKKVEAYRNDANLHQIDSAGGTLAQSQLTSLNADLAAARSAKAEAASRAALLQSILRRGSGDLDAVRDVLQSSTIQSLKQQKAIATAQIAELRATHLSLHPKVQGLKAQIEEIDLQIFREARNISRALESEAEIAATREQAILSAIETLQANAASAANKSVGLRALEREATAQRDLLSSLLARYREAVARERSGFSKADARVISHAFTPLKPFYPRATTFGVFGALAGLLLGLLSAMAFALTDRRVFRPLAMANVENPGQLATQVDDVPASTPPQAAEAPAIEDSAPRGSDPTSATPAGGEADAAIAEAHTLGVSATNVSQLVEALHASQTPFLAVFSATEQEETLCEQISTIVARMLSVQETNSVIRLELVSRSSDADSPFDGLTELIADQVSFADVIYQDDRSAAHFIPFGRRGDDLVMSEDTFAVLMEALAQVYSHVVFDAGVAVAEERIDQLSRYPMAAALVIGDPAAPRSTQNLIAHLSGKFESVVVVDPSKDLAQQDAA